MTSLQKLLAYVAAFASLFALVVMGLVPASEYVRYLILFIAGAGGAHLASMSLTPFSKTAPEKEGEEK